MGLSKLTENRDRNFWKVGGVAVLVSGMAYAKKNVTGRTGPASALCRCTGCSPPKAASVQHAGRLIGSCLNGPWCVCEIRSPLPLTIIGRFFRFRLFVREFVSVGSVAIRNFRFPAHFWQQFALDFFSPSEGVRELRPPVLHSGGQRRIRRRVSSIICQCN